MGQHCLCFLFCCLSAVFLLFSSFLYRSTQSKKSAQKTGWLIFSECVSRLQAPFFARRTGGGRDGKMRRPPFRFLDDFFVFFSQTNWPFQPFYRTPQPPLIWWSWAPGGGAHIYVLGWYSTRYSYTSFAKIWPNIFFTHFCNCLESAI